MIVTPFETYQHYLSLKNHFTNPKYDFFKYGAKTRASVTSFNKRKDKYWFEKTSRKYSDERSLIFWYLIFLLPTTHKTYGLEKLSILEKGHTPNGKSGNRVRLTCSKNKATNCSRRTNSGSLFNCSKGHPILLKEYLSGRLSLENFVIYDKIFHFSKNFDKKLSDPVWETVSLKLKKYGPFLNIDVFHFKKLLKEIINYGS